MDSTNADPGLGEGLSPAQLSVAARLVVASVLRLGTGVWEFQAVQVPDAGFLVVQGCMTREVVILGETAAIEFLAEGDLLCPIGEAGSASVDSQVVQQLLEPTRLAVLDRDFLLSVQPWPEVTAQLLRRQERRPSGCRTSSRSVHLPRVELRVLVLFWQFADRWGKVRGGEVSVPIPLTHLNVARLIGARRPTVTTALGKLVEAGLVVQKRNGYWLLRGGPPRQLRDAPAGTAAAEPSAEEFGT